MSSKRRSISSTECSMSASENEYVNVTRCIETRDSCNTSKYGSFLNKKKKTRRPEEGLFSWQTDRTGKEECISGRRDEILETINGITQHKHVTLPKIFLKKQKQTSRESLFFLLPGHPEPVDPLSYFTLSTELKEI
ncbi:Uncharacterized protein BM_BM10753 [Brugia malayi]|uniref:Bm10753 n=1 Tax=Brugia malayi TaxID=6279 RepID=A0A0K0IPD1_BRUMA|nr:Uncharacterized protein BM_BM10753 [Brugia malayi]CDP99427.1 Bm10753 [Brugia malayi]VIO99874.1 Uncharacterized protein BM_BM10753 [Brugia malayi]